MKYPPNQKPSIWGIDPGIVAYNCRKYGFPHPVLAMPMWESGGNRALDYSGHGNHGVLNGPNWVADGLDFDGSTHKFVDVGTSINMASWSAISISILVHYDSSKSNEHTLVSNWADAGAILFRLEPANDTVEAQIMVEPNTEIGGSFLDLVLTPNKEHCVSLTYDTTNGLQAYLDDVKSSTSYSSAAKLDATSSASLYIGTSPHSIAYDYLVGGIKTVSIFKNISLSLAQIKFLYENPYFMYEVPEELYGYISAVAGDTGLFDAKLRIKDSSIVLVDGLLRLKDKKIHLLDGKTKILNAATNLADGKVIVQDAGTGHTFDTSARTAENDLDPMTVSVTPTTGATVLVLAIMSGGTTARTGGTPTFNGDSLTQIESTVSGTSEITTEMWYLIDPSIGTYDVSVPNTNNRDITLVASVFKAPSGYTSALDVSDTNVSGSTQNTSISVTPTVDGAAIVEAMGHGNSAVPSANNRTKLYSVDEGVWTDNHQYALQATAGAIEFTWTVGGFDDVAQILAAFKGVAGPATDTSQADGKLRVKDSTTTLSDGKVKVIEKVTSQADGKIQLKDEGTGIADGKVQVKDIATSLADGKVKVLDVDTDLADGKLQVKDIATSLADGKVKVIEYVTNLADGKIKVKDVYTDIADGLVQIKDSATNLLDGKVRVKFIASNLADGKVRIKDTVVNLVDGKVRIKDAVTGLADGKVKVAEYVSNLADGKVKIKDKTTGLADGLIEIVGSFTSNVDGKIKVRDITTTLADGKVKVIEKVTSLIDGKVKIKDSATGIIDGLINIKDKATSLADGKINIKNLATSLADAKVKIKDTITDLLDGKVTITGLITGHPWFYRRKQ